ncbi:hypothetical protein ES706_06040 [subsurface metagenome]
MSVALAKCLLALLIERVHRFQAFLDEVSPLCTNSELQLVALYQALLDSVEVEEIKPSAIALSLLSQGAEEETSQDIINTVVPMLLITSVELDTLLAAADVFPRLQPRPESYEFVEGLFPANVYENSALAIVLWSDYNFGELELRGYLIEKMKETIAALGVELEAAEGTAAERRLTTLQLKPIVLYLAQLEKGNPLMWVPLAHEVGHSIEEERKISATVITGLHSKLNLEPEEAATELDFLKSWLPEFISDEIALRVLGPSYYCAFATFSILEPSPMDKPSTHPPPWNRLEMMKQHCTLPRTEDIINYFAKLVSEKRQWDEKLSGSQPIELTIVDWVDVYNEVKRQVENLAGDIDAIGHPSWETSMTLATERLRHALPVSSSVQGGNEQLKSMNELVLQIMHKVSELGVQTTPQEDAVVQGLMKRLDESIDNYRERPCEPNEIVGAGWFEKKTQLEEFSRDFLRDLQSFTPVKQWEVLDERVKQWKSRSTLIDSLLIKSLEITPILRLFGGA